MVSAEIKIKIFQMKVFYIIVTTSVKYCDFNPLTPTVAIWLQL